MIVQFVKFKSSLANDEVQRVMRERAPRFRALPGLVQKYYGLEEQSGEFTGIYLWDSEQSAKDFQDTELARTIPVAYKVEGKPRIEFFELLFPLRGWVRRSDSLVLIDSRDAKRGQPHAQCKDLLLWGRISRSATARATTA